MFFLCTDYGLHFLFFFLCRGLFLSLWQVDRLVCHCACVSWVLLVVIVVWSRSWCLGF
ncbi:hypothetical protein QBC47DRAFT_375463 [Echria macrotheca]|uniref:Uncharacterized protein n=1 Tax=Echria macrotheca TaxID=438768 RepID=A0AAJ0FCT5_9PEZI|nr:hypothetical protein QBC47DRAFT_375463 [Echria macrotheca]